MTKPDGWTTCEHGGCWRSANAVSRNRAGETIYRCTAGHTVRASIDKLQAEGQWEISQNAQITMGMYDSIGGCMFLGTAIGPDWELLCDLLNARYGWQLARDDLSEMGKEVLRVERAFNREVGFGPTHDRLPRFMETEPLPPYNEVFDVSEMDLDRLAEI